MPVVFVIAEHWMLRAGVRAELREQGVDALGVESAEEVSRALAAGQAPSAVVLDEESKAASDPAVQQLIQRIPTVAIASRTVAERLDSAAKVLFRPVQISEIVAAVAELLQGSSA